MKSEGENTISKKRPSLWETDCNRFWGKVLSGKFAHWCPDFDYLPIDETCELEFECCTCDLKENNS